MLGYISNAKCSSYPTICQPKHVLVGFEKGALNKNGIPSIYFFGSMAKYFLLVQFFVFI